MTLSNETGKHAKPALNNRTYDTLKYIAQIVLPGLGALYFGLAQIWGLPAAEQVVGTITTVDIFLGLLLGFSANTYNKSDAKYDGQLNLYTGEDRDVAELDLRDVENLSDKQQLTIKVEKPNRR